MSLVESWPSTEMRSNERLTQTPSSRSAVSGCERGVGLRRSRASSRRPARSSPRPWPARSAAPCPRAARPRARAFLGNASVVRIASPKSASPSAAQLARGRGEPADDLVGVELHADHAGRADGDPVLGHAGRHRGRALHARRVVEPAAAGRGVGVAGVGRRRRGCPSSRQRSRVTSTGAASTPERVKRAALTVSAASQTSRPRSGAPERLEPAATPAARKPAGRPPGISVTWSGASTQREAKVTVTGPRSRRGRTSG